MKAPQSPISSAERLIGDAIEAVESGKPARARQLLTIVLNSNPTHEQAVFLMVEAIIDQQQQISVVRRAARVDPTNQRIAQLLESLETDLWSNQTAAQLNAGSRRAIGDGHRDVARRIVTFLLRRDSNDERAWLTLADLSDDLQAKRECLQTVLEINPKNSVAKYGLRRVAYVKECGKSQEADLAQKWALTTE